MTIGIKEIVFCVACLEDVEGKSPDPRYCLRCYDFLQAEAGNVTSFVRPRWAPKGTRAPIVEMPTADITTDTPQTHRPPINKVGTKRIKGKTTTPKPKPTFVPTKKGRPAKDLPEDAIRKLAAEGVPARKIVSILFKKDGVAISYKTAQRIISGQRRLELK